MGQLPLPPADLLTDVTSLSPSLTTTQSILYPIKIETLSHLSNEWNEMWCGSEYTIGCTESGELWSRGWSEHGNLGHGLQLKDKEERLHICTEWVRVEGAYQQNIEKIPFRFKNSWSGRLACGGAHCLILVDQSD
jgi:hypothetical protein